MRIHTKSVLMIMILFGISAIVEPERDSGRKSIKTTFWQDEVFSFPPVNGNASQEARELLFLLYQLKGKYTLAGQHNFLEKPDLYRERVKQLTGYYPAVQGYEMGAILNQSKSEIRNYRRKVVDSAIDWHQSGGIVTMTYHANLPGQCPCWDKVNNGGVAIQLFENIVTPGTDLNKSLLDDLDEVAYYLKQLRDAGVPVLWRPYHEMNGGWFWWGKQSDFTRLWEIMFDRYTKFHHLDNLLWVWSPNAPNHSAESFESYYVGPLRADILAVDIYGGDYKQSHHDQLWVLSGGKPMAIAENDKLPAPEMLSGEQKFYGWYMGWGNELEKNNQLQDIRALYEYENVLTISGLNAIRSKGSVAE